MRANNRLEFAEIYERFCIAPVQRALHTALWMAPPVMLEGMLALLARLPKPAECREAQARQRVIQTLERYAAPASGSRAEHELAWHRRCAMLRLTGRLADSGPVGMLECCREAAPDHLASPEDEETVRRRAEIRYLEHLTALTKGRRATTPSRLFFAPLPSDPIRPASDEAVKRTVWIFTGLLNFTEPLSAEAHTAVRALLMSTWPEFPGGRVTRGVIEEWQKWLASRKYNKDCRNAYGFTFGRRTDD